MASGRATLARFAWLSVAAAVVTIALKAIAYRVTGSVGLLSDAVESLVNLAAALLTLGMVTLAARPPDEEHAFGYSKAEYVASGAEGVLIFLAAAAIGWTALHRLFEPRAIESAGLGVAVSAAASLVNLGVARVLLRAARRRRSIALEADARHLMTDVWTSFGVVAGIGAVAITGWRVLDPLIALAVAAQILRTGTKLARRSLHGLLDQALAPEDLRQLHRVLAEHAGAEVQFHALRTRQAGARRFIALHVLVPGSWSVQRGHALCERVEVEVCAAIPNAIVFTHLEALEDPSSFQDQELDRAPPDPPESA